MAYMIKMPNYLRAFLLWTVKSSYQSFLYNMQHHNLYVPLFRKPTEDIEEYEPQQRDDSHNIAIHVKKAHGGLTLYEPKKFEEKLVEFLDILKKL